MGQRQCRKGGSTRFSINFCNQCIRHQCNFSISINFCSRCSHHNCSTCSRCNRCDLRSKCKAHISRSRAWHNSGSNKERREENQSTPSIHSHLSAFVPEGRRCVPVADKSRRINFRRCTTRPTSSEQLCSSPVAAVRVLSQLPFFE